jgi:hypothetical protein
MLKRCKESENRIVLEPANNRNAGTVRKGGGSETLKRRFLRGRRFTQLKLKEPEEAVSMVQAKDSSLSERPGACTGGD